jgi:hypothetical protein
MVFLSNIAQILMKTWIRWSSYKNQNSKNVTSNKKYEKREATKLKPFILSFHFFRDNSFSCYYLPSSGKIGSTDLSHHLNRTYRFNVPQKDI